MASSYVNDLRLEEIGTGEQSGTWGATTNTNLELIGEAFGYGTEGITTNADTHTSTIADGATDPVRAMFVKYTGTLDSACTITIAPNTVNRMQFIENATSGSQNIIISQGSGANITIPAGDVKAVYLDGAGSGAAVVDAFASLSVVDLKVQDDLTVTDDLTVNGDIDLAGSIDVDGTTNLDAVDIDGAVQIDGTVTVGVDDTGLDVKFFGATSGAYMLWDESADDLKLVGAAGLTVAGDIDVDGTTNLDAVDIDGAVQLDSTLSVGVDGTGHDVKFFGDTASAYMLWDQSTDDLILGGAAQLGIGTATPGHPLHIVESADGPKIRLTRGGLCEWDISIGSTSTLSGVGSGALELLPQNSGTANEFAIGQAGTTTAIVHVKHTGTTITGTLECSGALSKGSGSFKIDHPLEAKKDTHHLIHSFIEGPQADLIYRGTVDLSSGSATINIDTAAGMTDGTFVLLCRDVQCFTTNEDNWDLVKGSVSGNTLTITSQNSSSTATISWLVIGERKDEHMIETGWTDSQGRVIVEPSK